MPNRNYSQKQAPLYILVYDIGDNNERAKLDKLLQGYGFRVQKSVYECRLSRWHKQKLHRLIEALKISTGHVRCYGVHSNNMVKFGNIPKDVDEDFVYVFDSED